MLTLKDIAKINTVVFDSKEDGGTYYASAQFPKRLRFLSFPPYIQTHYEH